MPRRKKNGQSPARAPGGPSEAGSLVGHDAGYRPPQGHDAAMAGGFRSGDSKIVKSMQEMFSHLDPEVIYIVLSECDFKGTAKHGGQSAQPAERLLGNATWV